MAGYTIAIRIIIFAIMPAWGLANAATTLVGLAVIFIVFAEPVIRLFTGDPEVLAFRRGAWKLCRI